MKNLRAIIAASIATLTIFLSGCSSFNYMRLLFISKETREELGNLQQTARQCQEDPDYYARKHQYHPTSTRYRDRIYGLPAEDWPRTKAEIEELDKE